jgi:hypothetical protein
MQFNVSLLDVLPEGIAGEPSTLHTQSAVSRMGWASVISAVLMVPFGAPSRKSIVNSVFELVFVKTLPHQK